MFSDFHSLLFLSIPFVVSTYVINVKLCFTSFIIIKNKILNVKFKELLIIMLTVLEHQLPKNKITVRSAWNDNESQLSTVLKQIEI